MMVPPALSAGRIRLCKPDRFGRGEQEKDQTPRANDVWSARPPEAQDYVCASPCFSVAASGGAATGAGGRARTSAGARQRTRYVTDPMRGPSMGEP